MADDILIFGGSGSPRLTRSICEYLDMQARLKLVEGRLRVTS